jgi:hypothetical protein
MGAMDRGMPRAKLGSQEKGLENWTVCLPEEISVFN